jgi:hypothetical protein
MELMKSLVYEIKLQTLAEVTGHIFVAAVHIRNDGTMLCRPTGSLLKGARSCFSAYFY